MEEFMGKGSQVHCCLMGYGLEQSEDNCHAHIYSAYIQSGAAIAQSV